MLHNHNKFTEPTFERLTSGVENHNDVASILAHEATLNLATVQYFKDTCDTLSEQEQNEARRLWIVLGEMQQEYPHEFDKMWQYPLVSARWRTFLEKIDSNGKAGEQESRQALLELGSIAGSLAVQCGVSFEAEIAVHDNLCMLPTLGAVILPQSGGSAWLQVTSGQASLRYASEDGRASTIPLPSGRLGKESAQWMPVRKFSYNRVSNDHYVALDDVDPYRACFGQDIIRERFTQNEADLWCLSLTYAASVLQQSEFEPYFRDPYPPEKLAAMFQGIQVIVPLKPFEANMATATSINAVGAIGLSRPPDIFALGEALVHEYHHTKLTGLLSQRRLFEPNSSAAVHYAPWRSDPRPVFGLLHGLYASVGIMNYWQRLVKPGGTSDADRLVQYHYSLWAHRVKIALPTLQDTITAADKVGTQVLRYLEEEIATIDSLPPTSTAASIVAIDHEISWRIDNHQPDPATISTLTDAFIDNRTSSLSLYSLPPPIIESPKTPSKHFRQLLLGEGFSSPPRVVTDRPIYLERMLDVPAEPQTIYRSRAKDYPEADLALFLEYPDSSRAQQLYRQAIQTAEPHTRRSFWAGYLLAMTIDGTMPDHLLKAPELYHHMYEEAVSRRGIFDPQELIDWLHRNSGPPDDSSRT